MNNLYGVKSWENPLVFRSVLWRCERICQIKNVAIRRRKDLNMYTSFFQIWKYLYPFTLSNCLKYICTYTYKTILTLINITTWKRKWRWMSLNNFIIYLSNTFKDLQSHKKVGLKLTKIPFRCFQFHWIKKFCYYFVPTQMVTSNANKKIYKGILYCFAQWEVLIS